MLSDHWGWVRREKSGACSFPTLSVSHAPLWWLLIVLWFGASSLTLCPSPSSHPSSHGRPINLPKGQACSCKHSLQWLHVACQTDRRACAELHILPCSTGLPRCSFPTPCTGLCLRCTPTHILSRPLGICSRCFHSLETSPPGLCHFKSWLCYLLSDLQRVTPSFLICKMETMIRMPKAQCER